MTIKNSKNVVLSNIYVNSTTFSRAPARNTDGADTLFSDNITFDRWTVDNGDDSISIKANSTNILIKDSTFYRGLGVAIGSIGQYLGAYETVENVTVTNIDCYNTRRAAYIKTWTGQQVNYPPNGGGGGLGCKCSFLFLIKDLRPIPRKPYQQLTSANLCSCKQPNIYQFQNAQLN